LTPSDPLLPANPAVPAIPGFPSFPGPPIPSTFTILILDVGADQVAGAKKVISPDGVWDAFSVLLLIPNGIVFYSR
jgi:hypothetical protein